MGLCALRARAVDSTSFRLIFSSTASSAAFATKEIAFKDILEIKTGMKTELKLRIEN